MNIRRFKVQSVKLFKLWEVRLCTIFNVSSLHPSLVFIQLQPVGSLYDFIVSYPDSLRLNSYNSRSCIVSRNVFIAVKLLQLFMLVLLFHSVTIKCYLSILQYYLYL